MSTDRESVQKVLSEAHAAVEAAGLPDDLRSVAFGKAVDMLGGTPTPAAIASPDAQQDGNGSYSRLGKIAKRLGIDAKTAEYFFDPGDDDVTLVVPRSKLDTSKANATREVALLYCAARQAGGYDDSHTRVASIRAKVDDMGVLDATNFASHVKNIEGMSARGQSAQSREFKVSAHGYEQAGMMISKIKGGSS